MLTTHYMEEAQVPCDRVAIMDRGRIVAMDSPQALIRALPTPYQIRARVGDGLGPTDFASLDGVQDATSVDGTVVLRSSDAARTLPALVGVTSQRGVALEYLEVTPATLEDVFLALTGRALRE